nr:hypothetical protein GCM10017611_76980 [Rhodococcus wratislaviensis]
MRAAPLLWAVVRFGGAGYGVEYPGGTCSRFPRGSGLGAAVLRASLSVVRVPLRVRVRVRRETVMPRWV